MKTFDDLLRPRLLRGELHQPDHAGRRTALPVALQALPHLTLRLGLVASVYFDATACIGVIRRSTRRSTGGYSAPCRWESCGISADQHPARALRGASELAADPRRFLLLVDRGGVHAVRQAREGELAPLTILPTAKYFRAAASPLGRRPARLIPTMGLRATCRWHYGCNHTADRRDGRRMRMVATALAGDMDTFPKYLLRNAEGWATTRHAPGLRHLAELSWREQLEEIRRLALGFRRSVSAGRPDRSHRRQPPVYTGPSPLLSRSARFPVGHADGRRRDGLCADHAGVRFAVVQDRTGDKIRSCVAKIPALTDVIYDEPAASGYPGGLHAFSDVQATGAGRLAAGPSLGRIWEE